MKENKQIDTPEVEMTFFEHLEELRWRLIKSIVAVLIGAIISFFFSQEILDFLIQPFREALAMHAKMAGETPPESARLIFLAPTEGFMVSIKLAMFAGLFLSLPFVFYQVWKFLAPGLLEKEKKYIPRIVFFSTLFFLLGAAFCYTVVIRYGLNFLLGYQSPELVANISIKEYLRFVTLLILTFGIVFEMPILTFFLGRMGLVTPKLMREKRRYSIVLIFVLAALITPPDVFTQMMLALPLIILYETSIWVCKFAQPKPGKTETKPAEKGTGTAEDKPEKGDAAEVKDEG